MASLIHTIQVDVLAKQDVPNFVTCVIYTDFRQFRMYLSERDYQDLIRDGFFIRTGKTVDSANVVNTTHTYSTE